MTRARVIHVVPDPRGRWFVRVGDDAASATEHPSESVAERQAHRRAVALGIGVIVIHDRYQRVRETQPIARRRAPGRRHAEVNP